MRTYTFKIKKIILVIKILFFFLGKDDFRLKVFFLIKEDFHIIPYLFKKDILHLEKILLSLKIIKFFINNPNRRYKFYTTDICYVSNKGVFFINYSEVSIYSIFNALSINLSLLDLQHFKIDINNYDFKNN